MMKKKMLSRQRFSCYDAVKRGELVPPLDAKTGYSGGGHRIIMAIFYAFPMASGAVGDFVDFRDALAGDASRKGTLLDTEADERRHGGASPDRSQLPSLLRPHNEAERSSPAPWRMFRRITFAVSAILHASSGPRTAWRRRNSPAVKPSRTSPPCWRQCRIF